MEVTHQQYIQMMYKFYNRRTAEIKASMGKRVGADPFLAWKIAGVEWQQIKRGLIVKRYSRHRAYH